MTEKTKTGIGPIALTVQKPDGRALFGAALQAISKLHVHAQKSGDALTAKRAETALAALWGMIAPMGSDEAEQIPKGLGPWGRRKK